jgi:hypothetical protein
LSDASVVAERPGTRWSSRRARPLRSGSGVKSMMRVTHPAAPRRRAPAMLVLADHPPKTLIPSDMVGTTCGLRPPDGQRPGFSLATVIDAPVRGAVQVLSIVNG